MKAGVGDKAKYMSYKLKHMTSWALVIKLCDRLDNLKDTRGMSDTWKLKYVKETEYILTYLLFHRQLTKTHTWIIGDLWEVLEDRAAEVNYEITCPEVD
jgi:(p)ppGpp synthase/HD superfamily hydrolase